MYLTGTGTPATGKTVAVTVSKNHGAFGNPAAGAVNATEIGNGYYYYTPTGADTTTNGAIIWYATNAACDSDGVEHRIVPAANGRLSNLDVASSTLATSSLLTTVAGYIDTEIGTILTNIADLPTNAELATALGTADDAVLAQIALVKATTDQFVFTVAGQVDANAESMNGAEILGVGTILNKWRGA